MMRVTMLPLLRRAHDPGKANPHAVSNRVNLLKCLNWP